MSSAQDQVQHEAWEYLQPEVLRKIENLELIAKFIVEGMIIGLHRSPYHGFSVEFSSYRKYSPGDDIKFLDWRVFARTDRFFIKQFEETTNLNCYLVLDSSGSMGMAGSSGVSKLDYARYLLAGLSYLMLGQSDSVALLNIREDHYDYVPPSGRAIQLGSLLTQLSRAEPTGQTNLSKGLEYLSNRVKGRSMIIIVSDLLLDRDAFVDALSYFRYRNHEVIVFHVLNDLERTFPFTNVTTFRDMETGREVFTEPAAIRRRYLELLDLHVESLRRTCFDMEIDFVSLTTTESLGTPLLSYLARRQAAV